MRTRLLEVASRVVADGGPTALTVRDVAARAGTSASAVYDLFGDRSALLGAVGEEALRRFAAHLAAAPRTDDAERDLLALGLAYRASALDDPHFYRVMFDTAGLGARGAAATGRVGPPAAGPATAPATSPATDQPTFAVLADAVARVLRARGVADRAAAPAAVPAALALWGLVHGLVELELAGLLPGDRDAHAERYAATLRAAGPALVADLSRP